MRPIWPPVTRAISRCVPACWGWSLKQDDVIKALDHAKIAKGPSGPAQMVSGQHHLRMNMYIAQANNGSVRNCEEPGSH